RPGAAYLTLKSDVDDRLVGVTTPVADEVTLHATETDTAGVSWMTRIEALDLLAEEAVTLTPGSMHLMLTGLSEKLAEGSTFPLTLRFETAGEIRIDVPVLGVAAIGPEGPAE
uniref:copper chaperone PCu(A)C n=1 Tax=uncultured Jannaschia sp. TaxID=293347 RepID=UPI00261E09FD